MNLASFVTMLLFKIQTANPRAVELAVAWARGWSLCADVEWLDAGLAFHAHSLQRATDLVDILHRLGAVDAEVRPVPSIGFLDAVELPETD